MLRRRYGVTYNVSNVLNEVSENLPLAFVTLLFNSRIVDMEMCIPDGARLVFL